jgi:hypothetical protein
MTNPTQVRTELVKALELDLVGPPDDDSAHREEILTQAPSTWYLTGFLAPRGSSDDTAEEGVEEMSTGGHLNPYRRGNRPPRRCRYFLRLPSRQSHHRLSTKTANLSREKLYDQEYRRTDMATVSVSLYPAQSSQYRRSRP